MVAVSGAQAPVPARAIYIFLYRRIDRIRMNSHGYLILAALVCAALAIAGCTSGTAPSVTPATPAPVPSSTLASLALTPADVPAGYTLTQSSDKSTEQMGALALELGWQSGYYVLFTNNSVHPVGRATILQSIAVYQAESMSGVMGLIGKQEHAVTGMNVTDIPSPGIGTASGGVIAVSAPQTLAAETTSPLPKITESSQVVYQEGYVEVYFSKGSTLEVIRMTGPGADAATVTSLARTAYAKMP